MVQLLIFHLYVGFIIVDSLAKIEILILDDSNGDIKEPDVLKEASGELLSHRLPNGMIAPLHDVYYFSKRLVTGKAQDRKQKKVNFSPADVVSRILYQSDIIEYIVDYVLCFKRHTNGCRCWSKWCNELCITVSFVYVVLFNEISLTISIDQNRDKEFSFIELLNAIRSKMEGKYTQRPQLSSSHELDMDFDFVC